MYVCVRVCAHVCAKPDKPYLRADLLMSGLESSDLVLVCNRSLSQPQFQTLCHLLDLVRVRCAQLRLLAL